LKEKCYLCSFLSLQWHENKLCKPYAPDNGLYTKVL